MALGTPYKFCGGNAGTGSATLTVTASGTSSTVGDALHLWATSNGNNFPATCSDSAGNTYNAVGTQVTNGALNGQWYECLNSAHQVVSGTTTISIVLTGSGTSKSLSGVGCSGVATSSALDQDPTPTTGTSTTPSITSAALAQASELCLSGVVFANGGAGVTWNNSFTLADTEHPGVAQFGSCAFLVVSATTAVTSSATITSAAWGEALITLEAAGAAVAAPAPGQPPRIAHPGPHRVTWRARQGGAPNAPQQVHVPPKFAPRIPHRAAWEGRRGTPPAALRQPFTPKTIYARPPRRVIWRGGAGTTFLYGSGLRQPSLPVTVYRRAPRRVIWRGGAGSQAPIVSVPGAPTYLEGNQFSLADSDFESALTGNWAATTNCALAQSSTREFTGDYALRISTTAAGVSVFTYAGMPVIAGLGYTLSWYAIATANSRTAQVKLVFRNSGGTQVGSTVSLTTWALLNGSWLPAADTFTPPATAVTADISITVSTPGTTEHTYFDLFYLAQTDCQVLVAWGSNPLASSPQFADMTPWVRADQGVSYTRGRIDEISDVQPGTANLTFDNTLGWFAQGNTAGPYSPSISRRIRISFFDEVGTAHTRFDGTITDLVPSWPSGPGLESLTAVACQGLLAWLSRGVNMRTMLEQEILLDNPTCLYTLAEDSTANVASDSSGNAAPPLQQAYFGTAGGKLQFGSGAGIIGFAAPGFSSSPLSSALFTPHLTVAAVDGGFGLQGKLAAPVTAAAGLSAELWFNAAITGAVSGQPLCLMVLGTSPSLSLTYATNTSDITLTYTPASGSTTSVTSSAVTAGQVAFALSGTTATLYVNGVSQGTLTTQPGFTAAYLRLAAPEGIGVPSGLVWSGSLNCATVWPSALSGARFLAHYTAGAGQNWGDLIAVLTANMLKYGGIPAAFTSVAGTGVSYADAYEISGNTPLDTLQVYQQADGGVIYESAAGQIVFQDRAQRYANQVTPALVLSAGQYEVPLAFPTTTQFLVNDATFANDNIPGGMRATNDASVALNGTYPDGDPLSPQTGPWYSFPYTGTSEVIAGSMADGDVLMDAVDWETNIYGTPVPRSPSVSIDLATQPASEFSRATAYTADIGSVLELTGLPSSGPGGTRVSFLVVEGVTETFTRDGSGLTWTLAFNTSPGSQSAAWVPGDANMGVLDSTAVTGRGTDGATVGGYQYAGPPYPVPTFSGSMNETGNVGANDMRGLASNVQQAITPPLAVVQQVSLAQSIASGGSGTDVQWDTILADSASGFGLSGDVVAYHVQVPGQYLFLATVVFPTSGTGDRRAWFQLNGSGGAFAETQVQATGGVQTAVLASQVIQCALGDKVKVTCFQNSGSSQTLATTNGGCFFSVLYLGA